MSGSSGPVTHIIWARVVTNTIAATVDETRAAFPGADDYLDRAVYDGGPGWTWDGVTLTAPPE